MASSCALRSVLPGKGSRLVSSVAIRRIGGGIVRGAEGLRGEGAGVGADAATVEQVAVATRRAAGVSSLGLYVRPHGNSMLRRVWNGSNTMGLLRFRRPVSCCRGASSAVQSSSGVIRGSGMEENLQHIASAHPISELAAVPSDGARISRAKPRTVGVRHTERRGRTLSLAAMLQASLSWFVLG